MERVRQTKGLCVCVRVLDRAFCPSLSTLTVDGLVPEQGRVVRRVGREEEELRERMDGRGNEREVMKKHDWCPHLPASLIHAPSHGGSTPG